MKSHLGLRPFTKGDDPRRGRGPQAGAANAGRPPDAVRAACRDAFDKRVPMLAELADTGTPDIRLRALDMLGRYGLGTSFTLDNPDTEIGVIALPELELQAIQAQVEVALLTQGRSYSVTGEDGTVYRVEDAEPGEFEPPAREVVEDQPAPAARVAERTVDPEIVRRVRAARHRKP